MQARLQNAWGLPQGFLSDIARGRFEGWIHVLDDALSVGQDHAVRRLLHGSGQQEQGLHSLATLGEIVEHQDASGDQSGWVFERPCVRSDPHSARPLTVAHEDKLIDNFLPAHGTRQRQLIGGQGRYLIRKVPPVEGGNGVGQRLDNAESQYPFCGRIGEYKPAILISDDHAPGKALEDHSQRVGLLRQRLISALHRYCHVTPLVFRSNIGRKKEAGSAQIHHRRVWQEL